MDHNDIAAKFKKALTDAQQARHDGEKDTADFIKERREAFKDLWDAIETMHQTLLSTRQDGELGVTFGAPNLRERTLSGAVVARRKNAVEKRLDFTIQGSSIRFREGTGLARTLYGPEDLDALVAWISSQVADYFTS